MLCIYSTRYGVISPQPPVMLCTVLCIFIVFGNCCWLMVLWVCLCILRSLSIFTLFASAFFIVTLVNAEGELDSTRPRLDSMDPTSLV